MRLNKVFLFNHQLKKSAGRCVYRPADFFYSQGLILTDQERSAAMAFLSDSRTVSSP
jgi:hypothetical protein